MLSRLVFVFCILWSFAAAVHNGSCVCLNATMLARPVTLVANLTAQYTSYLLANECAIATGKNVTSEGYTFIQLQNVNCTKNVWTLLQYLTEAPDSRCHPKIVSTACLDCICQQESKCKPIGCHYDVNSLSCGYFQIKEAYWRDCGCPGENWTACADNKTCSSQCVQNYMNRYAKHYNCPLTCEGFAREHNGGPRGCHHDNTLGYWHGVKSQTGCKYVV